MRQFFYQIIYTFQKKLITKFIFLKEIEILKTSTRSINSDYLEKLIKSIYTNIGFKDKNEFIEHIKKFNINIQTIEKKLSEETLWNQLIYNKFFSKVKIDKEKIKSDFRQ